jgi:hypothetical protein
MSTMRRNRDVPHIGRALADKAADLGPSLYDAEGQISPMVQTNYSFNSTVPDARTGSARKKLGTRESDLNPGYRSKNTLGGTPVRVIDKRKNSYNE